MGWNLVCAPAVADAAVLGVMLRPADHRSIGSGWLVVVLWVAFGTLMSLLLRSPFVSGMPVWLTVVVGARSRVSVLIQVARDGRGLVAP